MLLWGVLRGVRKPRGVWAGAADSVVVVVVVVVVGGGGGVVVMVAAWLALLPKHLRCR
jgi:hypothetical protein